MKIHFIGICGVAMSALARALKQAGHTITGSDKGFFPPISTYLKNNDVSYYPGWHPEKMIQDGVPDLVVVGNVAGSTNPEWIYVQEHNISYVSYPELIQKLFLKQQSIVCAGTYGKTSSAALLSHILTQDHRDPSYMFGGLCIDQTPSAHIGNGEWSVLEGDEYKTARWDTRPKFAHYAPTHLLLTAIEWDHADVYPTAQAYYSAFDTLISTVPPDGILIISERVQHVDIPSDRVVITYGLSDHTDYQYDNVVSNINGISFDIMHQNETFHIHSPLVSEYQAENITGCFALAHTIGIPPNEIIQTIQSHTGLKRRMEKRYDKNILVLDDIAHSPTKASSALSTARSITTGKIIAIFEPNTGNRHTTMASGYNHAFKDADTVIIPRLTVVKTCKGETQKPLDGAQLASIIARTHPDTHHIEDDDTLIRTLVDKVQKNDTIIFLGSHGFRGMIENVIQEISNKQGKK